MYFNDQIVRRRNVKVSFDYLCLYLVHEANNLNISTTQSKISNVNLSYTTACNAVSHLCTLFDIFKAVNYFNITLIHNMALGIATRH